MSLFYFVSNIVQLLPYFLFQSVRLGEEVGEFCGQAVHLVLVSRWMRLNTHGDSEEHIKRHIS